MKNNGMHFGIHGINHNWFEHLTKKEQEIEIRKSLKFMKKIFPNEKNFSICYPHGSYNKHTIKLVKKYNLIFGLTIKHGIININKKYNKFLLPRIDTNYLL